MTARSSIERLADEAPVPSATSWPSRRPPSPATAAVHAALEAQARKTARTMIKMRARAYALRPRELDAIAEGLFNLFPSDLVTSLSQISAVAFMRGSRSFGFGGEVPAINLRGAALYARFARATANQLSRRRKANAEHEIAGGEA
jgi:hypothetical protein